MMGNITCRKEQETCANAQRQPGDRTYQRKQNSPHSHTPHNQRLIFQQENRQGEKRADLRVFLKRRAQQLMDMMRITQEDLKDSADGVSGTLAIGMVASYGGALLPGLIADFNSQYPKVTFQLRQDSTREIMELAKAMIFFLCLIGQRKDWE